MTLLDHLRRFEKGNKTTAGVPQVVVQLRTILARIMIIQDAWQKFAAGATSKIRFPYSEVIQTINLTNNLIDYAYTNLEIPYSFVVDLRAAKRELVRTRFIRDLFDSASGKEEAFNATFVSSIGSKRVYTIQYGDTLRAIAGRILKDSNRWQELIELNALDFPYIVHEFDIVDAGLKILKPGDLLVLPRDAVDLGNAVLSEKPNSLASVLGRDIALTPRGALSFDGHGDFATVEGVDNIVQATRHRLMTDHGELALHPDYGSNLKALIGQEANQTNIAIAGLETGRTLLAEPRFTRVDGVVVNFDRTVIDIRFNAFVINDETPSPFNLVIERQG